MEFQEWLIQLKQEHPERAEFIQKIEPLIERGFDAAAFERRIEAGLQAEAEKAKINFTNPETNA